MRVAGSATGPERGARGRRPRRAEPEAHRRFTSTWASQIGITVAFLLLWLAFIVARPRDVPASGDLPLVRPDDALLRAHGDAPDAGHRRRRYRPLVPARSWRWGWSASSTCGAAPGASSWASSARSLVGASAGLFNGVLVTLVGIPSLVVTIGTQFLFRGLAARARGWPELHAHRSQVDACRQPAGREARGHPDGVLSGWPSSPSSRGSCSTGTGSARTPTSSATTVTPPG